MGMMINGAWQYQDRVVEDGTYIRPTSTIQNANTAHWIDVMQNQPGRVWLIASHSCPWSHRTTITRQLKGLSGQIPIHYAFGPRYQGYPLNGGKNWEIPGTTKSSQHLHTLYSLHNDRYTGQASVPLLWDSSTQSIVSNESSDIIAGFDSVTLEKFQYTLRPPQLVDEIDSTNSMVYHGLNNAVYKAGFAQSQDAYDESVRTVFKTLDELNERLSSQRYYFGRVLTETDVRLFPTLIRFDSIYYILFKCSKRRLVDYPALLNYTRDMFGTKGIADTTHFESMRTASYLADSDSAHPIVAIQPDMDWDAEHHRSNLGTTRIYCKNGDLVDVDSTNMRTHSQ